jgi:carbonic anhydrase/acetyltransferase-like protein (isoleucine patch superfamily)
MIRNLGDKVPQIHPSVYVSEAAYVAGDVEIGENSSVWPGAVIRGDFGKIVIGKNSHIEDNCVIHTGDTLTIGDNVIVGHGATVHCKKIGLPPAHWLLRKRKYLRSLSIWAALPGLESARRTTRSI